MKTIVLALLPIAILAALNGPTIAARWPDTVHRQFVLRGPQAIEFAGLFGISFDKETTLYFPTLGSVHFSEDIDYGGKAENKITFTTQGEEPSVILENKWNDSTTGTCEPVPQYWFLSPLIDPKLTVDNGWSVLLRQVKAKLPLLKWHAKTVKRIQIGPDTSRLIDVLIYIIEDGARDQWVFRVQIGIDERQPDQRDKEMHRYEEHQKRSPF